MNAWSGSDMADQTERVAVVTGANSGIGLETTRALADAGAVVIMACRSLQRGQQVRTGLSAGAADQAIGRSDMAGRLIVHELDLTEPSSVADFASWFHDEFGRLDLLVNNAGAMATPPELTDTGIERQWACNHLGHFALTGLLLPAFIDSEARVVSVSSLAAAGGDVSAGVRTDLAGYSRFGVYSDTKLANQVFATEFNHRLAAADSRAISVVAHPGVSHTNLAASTRLRFGTGILLALSRLATQSAADGALPILRAATDLAVEGGQYYGPSGRNQHRGAPKQIPLVPGAANRSLGRALWASSMELSGVRYLAGD